MPTKSSTSIEAEAASADAAAAIAETADVHSRFAAIDRLYGAGATERISALHVCIVGLGGVGSWAAECLARTGVGAITLIDYDTVCPTNINRQLHALSGTIGEKKHAVLAERIQEINPHCRLDVIDDYLSERTLDTYLSPQRGYGYVVDAIDSIKFKAGIIYYCKRNKIPVITTGAAGGLTDPTLIHVKDLSRTYNDPLAAKVRAKLRDDYNFSRNPKRYFGVECVFSGQQQVYPRPDGSVGHEKPGICGISLDCRFGYGSVSFVTATFGMVAASRVINKTLKKKHP
jgi:tRNA A37 threonylcarbamoyladenosine dehydratase